MNDEKLLEEILPQLKDKMALMKKFVTAKRYVFHSNVLCNALTFTGNEKKIEKSPDCRKIISKCLHYLDIFRLTFLKMTRNVEHKLNIDFTEQSIEEGIKIL